MSKQAKKSAAKASKKPAAAKPNPAPTKPKPAAKPKRTITVAGQPSRFIREIKIGARHRRDMGDIAALAKSIDDRGALLQPIVITADNKLIAGQRRLAAWPLTRFHREPIPVNIVDIDAIVMGERDENAQRKDFTPTEAVAIKREIEEFLKAQADARPTSKRAAPGRPAEDGGRAADKAAGYVGKDRRTIEKAEKILEAAERDPERFGGLVEDMNRTGRVDGPFKRLENIQTGERLKAEPPPPPMQGPYRTLVVDFPWPADLDGHRDQATRGYYPYATMSMEQIVAYAAEQIAPILHEEGAAVWLWIPNFHLARGCHTAVLAALGVQGSTMLTWVKPEIGQGQRLRGATEHAILAVKGKVPVLGTEQRTWFEAPAGKAHSAKPQAFFDIVETVTPAPRYAFLFAGGSVPEGWDGHGDRIGQALDDATNAATETARNIPENILDQVPAAFSEMSGLEEIESGRELDLDNPIFATLKAEKLARGSVKLKLTKLGMARLEALRKEEYSKFDDAPPADCGDDDQVQENSIPQVDCRVCSEGTGICADCVPAADHVITESVIREFDDPSAAPREAVATCSCGFELRMGYVEDDGYANLNQGAINAEIKAHWQNVVTEARAASASVAQSDPLDIPACLRRAPAEAAE